MKNISLLLMCLFLSFQSMAQGISEKTLNDQEIKQLEFLNSLKPLIKTNIDSITALIDSMSRIISDDQIYLRIKHNTIKGSCLWDKGMLDSAKAVYRENLLLSRKYSLKEDEISALSNIGTIFYLFQEDDSALFYLNQSMRLSEETNDSANIAYIKRSLGGMYTQKGYYFVALKYILDGVEYYEQEQDTMRYLYSINSLINNYINMGDMNRSQSYTWKAIQLDSSYRGVNLLGYFFNGMGMVKWKLVGDLDSAGIYFNKALEVARQQEYSQNLSSVYLNLGGLEIDRYNYNEALNILRKSKSIGGNMNGDYYLSALSVNFGTAFFGLANYDSARYYYHDAARIAEKINSFDQLSKAYSGLYQIDSIYGNYQSSLKFYKKYKQANDSLINLEERTKTAELSVIHETEQKERENKLLHKQNKLQENVIIKQRQINVFIVLSLVFAIVLMGLLLLNRKLLLKARRLSDEKATEIHNKNIIIEQNNKDLTSTQQELIELNSTKDKFFAIIAHDLKNPFNSLLGNLDILESDYHEMDDESKMQIIRRLTESSRNTYSLLVNLLDWARTQKGHIKADIKCIDLLEIVMESAKFLKSRKEDKEHDLEVDIDPDTQVMADPNLLQAILINIVNNAIKFTPKGGQLKINTIITDTIVVLKITDNGVGIPKERIDQLFTITEKASTRGTENERGTGLGLILSLEFAKLIHGHISVESELGKGTTFSIEIPRCFDTKT